MLQLDAMPVVFGAWALAAALACVVLLVPTPKHKTWRRLATTALLVALAVAALVIAAGVVLVDVMDIFGGAPVEWSVRVSLAVSLGLVAAGLVVLLAPRGWAPGAWRRITAGFLVVVAALAGVLGVNAAYGMVHTVDQLFPPPVADATDGGALPAKIAAGESAVAEAAWSAPDDLPAVGTVVQVDIPGTVSGFTARPAMVYLPPAALVADPPLLPVVVMLSGQPGEPSDVLESGQFQQVLDDFAAAHGGLAPIVVSPDQLGAADANPLCIDGQAGNSATYLKVDVPDWIEQHLNVARDRLAWTFGGFSQGGTCTFQIGLAQPDRYGTDVVISPELEPSILGDAGRTLTEGFGGDQGAFDAAKPVNILAANAPYHDTTLLMGVGSEDAVFTMWGNQLAAAARSAGITVQQIVSPGTSHDFHTVHYTLEQALPVIMQRAGVVT